MGRNYNTDQYYRLTRQALRINKNFTLSTDIIVGFPGETEEDFDQTIDFVKKIGFLKIHVFPYSIRPGTKAATMKNQINQKEKIARSMKLRKISQQLTNKSIKSHLNKTRSVLFENKKNGYYYGFTDNFIRIRYKSNKDLENIVKKVKLSAKSIDYNHYKTL